MLDGHQHAKSFRRYEYEYEYQNRTQATANRLVVAKNTDIYRLRRAEQLLGRSLDERRLQLWAALLLARHLTSSA